MRIDVFFTAGEVDPAAMTGRTVLVIDVVRATSTITEALANGARAIYPTASSDEAIRLAASLGREDTLLCGERKGLKIEGFDLGNSPAEFTVDRVGGKRLVMTTTNGTRAFVAAAGADRVYAASLLNLKAVAEATAGDGDIALICAGKEDLFSLDDAVCAGLLIRRIQKLSGEDGDLNDAAAAARALAGSFKANGDFLAATAAGQALVQAGLGGDLPVCAERDRHAIVPEMVDNAIRLPK